MLISLQDVPPYEWHVLFCWELDHARRTRPHAPLPDGPIRGEAAADHARRRAKRRMKTQGYAISQRVRKRIEELIGWCKTVGGMARAWFIGRWKIRQQSEATAAAYNLLRMARLAPAG